MIMVYFVNFFVFLVINTGIQIATVWKLQKELEEKRAKAAEMNKSLDELTKNKRLEEDNKKEKRTIIMVILNSFINFILRFPEAFILIASSEETVPRNPLQVFFHFIGNFIDGVVDFSYLTYILTFSTNILIYYKFNKKFRDSFKAILGWKTKMK